MLESLQRNKAAQQKQFGKKLIIASTDRQQRSLSYPPYTHFSDYVTKDAIGFAISIEANKNGLYRHFISQKV